MRNSLLGSKFPLSEILRQAISDETLLPNSSSDRGVVIATFLRINSLFSWRISYLSYCHRAPCRQPKIRSSARDEIAIRRGIYAILDLTYFALFTS